MGFSGLVFFGADHSVQDGEVAGGILGFFWFRVYGSGLAQDDEVAGGRGGQLPNGLMRSLLGRREHQGGSPKTSDGSTPVQDDEVAGGRRGELPRALRVAEALVQLERDALARRARPSPGRRRPRRPACPRGSGSPGTPARAQ